MDTAKATKNSFPPFWFGWVLVLIAILMFLFASTSDAQTTKQVKYDTIQCHVESIDEFIQQPTTSRRTVRIFAVYNDKKQDISEIISVSKSVFEYIQMCKEHNIQPSLGIKLKDGVIVSIIRYKPHYIVQNRR